MRLSFDKRRVVITGASRGIGFAIASAFAVAGADLAICARGAADLEVAGRRLTAHGRKVWTGAHDVADAASVRAFVDGASAALGGIDVLVNNASASSVGNGSAAWSAALHTDVMGAVRATEAALPYLGRSPAAAIVSICSIRALTGSARLPAYAAAKAALASFTVSQAQALAASGIRVNAIAPGSIEFPGGVWERRRVEQPELYAATLQRVPSGRLGTAEEVANVALFLASDLASWITGQVIVVDGGQMHS